MKEHLYEVEVTYRTAEGKQERVWKTVRAARSNAAVSDAKEQIDRWGRTNVRTGAVRDLGEVN